MIKKRVRLLCWMAFGAVVCLMTSACRTCRETQASTDTHFLPEEIVIQRMHDIIIPELSFRPPATIIDALNFFKEVCRDYERSEVPVEQRGLSFVLKLSDTPIVFATSGEGMDPFASPQSGVNATTNNIPVVAALSARFISLYDALKLVCDVTGTKFKIRNGIVMIVPIVDYDGEWVTRWYYINPTFADKVQTSLGKENAVDSSQSADFEVFFKKLGVGWPDGASIEYSAVIGKMRATNTPRNLEVLETVLEKFSAMPRLVDVDLQVVAFNLKDIERLQLAGGVSKDSLVELRKKGRGRLIATAKALTKSGQETVMKAVQEVVYPTELETSVDAGCSNQTVRTSRAGALIPCNFDVREVGMTLQVVSEIMPDYDSMINVILTPQWVTLDRWESYTATLASDKTKRTVSFRQPVFGVTSFQTQTMVKDGETVLLGGGLTPDGEKAYYGFLTVKHVDIP